LHAHADGREGLRRGRHDRLAGGVINAVVDALSHLGVTHVDMPATPNRIWRVIQNAAMPRRRRVGGGEHEVICISQADTLL
jgi:hypothetical protein